MLYGGNAKTGVHGSPGLQWKAGLTARAENTLEDGLSALVALRQCAPIVLIVEEQGNQQILNNLLSVL